MVPRLLAHLARVSAAGVGLRWYYTPRFPVTFQPPNADIEMLTSVGLVALAAFLILTVGILVVLWKVPQPWGTLAFAALLTRFVQGQLDIFWLGAQGTIPWLIAGTALGRWRWRSAFPIFAGNRLLAGSAEGMRCGNYSASFAGGRAVSDLPWLHGPRQIRENGRVPTGAAGRGPARRRGGLPAVRRLAAGWARSKKGTPSRSANAAPSQLGPGAVGTRDGDDPGWCQPRR